MKTADFYQGTADAMGVPLYLYPDGSVSNFRRVGVEPAAMSVTTIGNPPIMVWASR